MDLPDLTELRDPKTRPKATPGPGSGRDPGPRLHLCERSERPGGTFAGSRQLPGRDRRQPPRRQWRFAPGRSWSLAAVEARDGLSYTAAFSERLVGTGDDGPETLPSYRVVPPPFPTAGVPRSVDPDRHGADDAGSSWIASDYRSTLYNHALPPNGRPSCIADDGRTAFMGASSGHVRGVNLLRLDGSVTLTVPSIAPKVWRDLAAITESP